jgi:hypothetical protein
MSIALPRKVGMVRENLKWSSCAFAGKVLTSQPRFSAGYPVVQPGAGTLQNFSNHRITIRNNFRA